MDGGEVVTVVSVVVAGLLSPLIAGRIATRGQEQRLAHDRTLHDLDDLRRELDRVGGLTWDAVRAASFLVAEDTDERGIEASRCSMEMASQVAHLQIRLGPKDPVVEAAKRSVHALSTLISDRPGLTADQVSSRLDVIGDNLATYFQTAHERVGSRT